MSKEQILAEELLRLHQEGISVDCIVSQSKPDGNFDCWEINIGRASFVRLFQGEDVIQSNHFTLDTMKIQLREKVVYRSDLKTNKIKSPSTTKITI